MIAVPGPSAFTRAMILTTLTLVTTLYAMTVTIANASLPQMQGTLSATTDQIALVVTFNIIATAIATPMTGWLAARVSRAEIRSEERREGNVGVNTGCNRWWTCNIKKK